MNPISMVGAARVGAALAGGNSSSNPKASLNKLINATKESHRAVPLSHLGGVQLTHELGGESPPARGDHYLFGQGYDNASGIKNASRGQLGVTHHKSGFIVQPFNQSGRKSSLSGALPNAPFGQQLLMHQKSIRAQENAMGLKRQAAVRGAIVEEKLGTSYSGGNTAGISGIGLNASGTGLVSSQVIGALNPPHSQASSQQQLRASQNEVKRLIKTKKFFDEVVGVESSKHGTPNLSSDNTRELQRINNHYVKPPPSASDQPPQRSLLAQTLMELKKIKLEGESQRQQSVGGLGSSNGQIQQNAINSKQNSVANLGNSGGSPRNGGNSLKGSIGAIKKTTIINAQTPTPGEETPANPRHIKKKSFEAKYKCWIDPNDQAYQRWVLLLLIVNIICIHIILPVRLSLYSSSVEIESLSKAMDLIVDIMNIADQVLQFFIPLNDIGGGLNSAYNFERGEVARDYFKSWFIIDTLANVPYGYLQLTAYPKLYLALMSLKLSRCRKAHSGLKKLVRKLGFGVVSIRFTISVWNLFMMLHLTACIWGTIGEINLETGAYATNWIVGAGLQDIRSPYEKYLNNIYWAAATIMTVGYGDIVPTNDDELIVACVVMMFGICLFTYNLSSLAQQFADIIKLNSQRGEQHQWAIEYLYHTPNLDERLIHKVEQYINANILSKNAEYFHQKISLARQDVDMQEILLLLTPSLKGQLTLFLYKDAIQRIPFLQGRDPQFYYLYLDRLEPVKFQRETVILKKGTVAQRMYFIVKGRVINTTCNRIYSDGAVIGETDIIYRSKRRDSFQALDEIVHVLRMDSRTVREVMKRFEDIRKDLYEMASSRARSNAENDQNFQKQLINHKEVINSMLEVLNQKEIIAEEELIGKQLEQSISSEEDKEKDLQFNDIEADQQQDKKDSTPVEISAGGAQSHRATVAMQMLEQPKLFSKSYGGHRNTLGLTQSAFGKLDSQQVWKKINTEEDNKKADGETLELQTIEGSQQLQRFSDLGIVDFRSLKQQKTPIPGQNMQGTSTMYGMNAAERNNNKMYSKTEREEDASSFKLDQHLILSPSPRNDLERRAQQNALHTIPVFNSALSSTSNYETSLLANHLLYQNPALANNNYGRDSNLYKSLEQRLTKNKQVMEQVIFHTRKSKLNLVPHQSKFQEYLDRLASSQHNHMVNEEIIETTQQALAGVTKYINVLQLLERNLDQPRHAAIDESILNMREMFKLQDILIENTERMVDKLTSKVQASKPPGDNSTLQKLPPPSKKPEVTFNTQPSPVRNQSLTSKDQKQRSLEFQIVGGTVANQRLEQNEIPLRMKVKLGATTSPKQRMGPGGNSAIADDMIEMGQTQEIEEEQDEDNDSGGNGLNVSQRRLIIPVQNHSSLAR